MQGLATDRMRRIEDLVRHRRHEIGDEEWYLANTIGVTRCPPIRDALPPLPPDAFLRAGGADTSQSMFAYSGAGHFHAIGSRLRELGYAWPQLRNILEFGCGTGRLARMFARHTGSYVGVDLFQPGLDWLRGNLGFGSFLPSAPWPPLDLPGGGFDALISISVLTHFSEAAQKSWLAEFARLLAPGGLLIQTVHGRNAMTLCTERRSWQDALSVHPEGFARLQTDLPRHGFAWVPHRGQAAGVSENYGVSFQTEEYIRSHWCEDFELLGVWSGAIGEWQDLVILRRVGREETRRQVPILPSYADPAAPAVESLALRCTPAKPGVGEPFVIEATAVGTDVHYQFRVSEFPKFFHTVADWSPLNTLRFVCPAPGRYGFVVNCGSGPGRRAIPSKAAGIGVEV